MTEQIRGGVGDWFEAAFALLMVGAVVGFGCVCVIAICVHFSHVTFDAVRAASIAFGGLAEVLTTAHFLQLFSSGEIEARDIWKSIGKFLVAFNDETPR